MRPSRLRPRWRVAMPRLALALVLLLLVPALAQANHPSPLPDDITTPNEDYHVHFTNNTPSPPGTDTNYMPTGQAQHMANALDNSNTPATGNPNGYHAGYVNLSFGAPDFDGAERQVQVFDCSLHGGCDSGNAPADRINMPSLGYKSASEACIRLVIGHELFHHVQYSYITFAKWSTWGGVPVEGTARMMQDKIYTDLDGGAGCITYPDEANGYLGNTNRNMWNLSYTSALFWTYMAEQLGGGGSEPTVGAGFIRRFWENAEENNAAPDTVGTIRESISEAAPGRTLEDVFHDFTIANYAKSLNVSALPNASRYHYLDDSDGTGSVYNVVTKAWTGSIPPTKGPTADSVVAWGAKYYEATPSANCTILGFKSTGDTAAYGLVASTGSGNATRLGKSVTTNFARAYINRPGTPYTKLGASVAGLSNPANFTYTFACGSARLEIVRPTSDYLAYVGEPDAPEPFLAIVNVYGPTELGEPSVEGLDVSDFQAWVGGESAANVAPILSGSYVQGSYWLVIQAPTKPTDGDYPLLIKLGALAADTKEGAVRYAKLVRDQEIVIDASGSMSVPAGNTKLDAAKNAGRLFVDAAPSDDNLGVVWFSGDLVEPNDDAFVIHTLQGVSGQRANAKAAINGLTPHNMTSIGDGLKKGQAEITAHGSPLAQDFIILLSDGMENEADFWNTVKPTLVANGTVVYSIALGPETDQALMQDIAASTGGDYLYVDLSGASPVAEGASASSPNATDATATLPNRLADAFKVVSEGVRQHQRIWQQQGSVAPGATQVLTIPIEEDGLTDAVFSVNWPFAAAVQVRLFKPNGVEVIAGGGVEVLNDSTHAVFQLPAIDMLGDWQLEVRNQGNTDLPITAALSAKGYKGVRLHIYFGQTPFDPSGTLQQTFLKGLPMPILASLTDLSGPVRGADVMAEVEHPDGSLDKLILYDDGNHGDGAADDGLYGNVYTRTDVGSTFGVPDNSTEPGTRGSYNVIVTATGKSDTGAFTRIRHGSFQVYELHREQGNPDEDQDEMPDRWELLHPCLNPKLNDAKEDADGDGLSNIEEFRLGTNPCERDTDHGGEVDLSEVKRGANPHDPTDDGVRKPIDVEVLHEAFDHLPDPPVRPNTNIIRYPVTKACVLYRLESRLIREAFQLVEEFDPFKYEGLYPDENLQNDVTYFYRLTCLGANGEESEPSNEFTGTPREDPLPPVGRVIIAHDRPFVTSTSVMVQLVADEDTVEMKVSNLATLADAGWQAFQPEIPWQLAPEANGRAMVYAQFRDKVGNESTVYYDGVIVRSSRLLGSIIGRVVLKPLVNAVAPAQTAADQAGVYVGVVGQSDIPPAYTDADGAYVLPDLPPGEYTLTYQMDGFMPQTQAVKVVEGQEIQPPEVTLAETRLLYLPVLHR